jgi:hypothetical protein
MAPAAIDAAGSSAAPGPPGEAAAVPDPRAVARAQEARDAEVLEDMLAFLTELRGRAAAAAVAGGEPSARCVEAVSGERCQRRARHACRALSSRFGYQAALGML